MIIEICFEDIYIKKLRQKFCNFYPKGLLTVKPTPVGAYDSCIESFVKQCYMDFSVFCIRYI